MKNINCVTFKHFFYEQAETPEHSLWQAIVTQCLQDIIWLPMDITLTDLDKKVYNCKVYTRKMDDYVFFLDNEDLLDDVCAKKHLINQFIDLKPLKQYDYLEYEPTIVKIEAEKKKYAPNIYTYGNRRIETTPKEGHYYNLNTNKIAQHCKVYMNINKKFITDILERCEDRIKKGDTFTYTG